MMLDVKRQKGLSGLGGVQLDFPECVNVLPIRYFEAF